ncbi:MAG: histidine kinase [Verrucomicrobiota bacterium]
MKRFFEAIFGLREPFRSRQLGGIETKTKTSPNPKGRFYRWKVAAIYLGVWVLVLAGLVAQYRWGITGNWALALVRVIRDWIPWVAIGPIVWWLAKRYPLFNGFRIRNVFVHLVASISLVIVAESMVAFAIHPMTQSLVAELRSEARPRENRRGAPRRPPPGPYELHPTALARKGSTWLPLYWVLVFLTSTIQQRRQSLVRKQRGLALERDLVSAQLEALQNRLQPHFLFNALNSVSTLVRIDPDKAEEMIDRLSGLLRNVLATGDKQRIPLRDELDLLRDYLSIESVRFSDRLTVEESIDDSVLDFMVPPLLLQPIAENAVKHGIEPKSEPSTLKVGCSLSDSDTLRLSIEDDGIGMGSASSAGSGSGVGHANIRSRLGALYGEEAQLTISDLPDGGTRVEITLPAEGE